MATDYEWDIESFDYDPGADDPQAGDIYDHRRAAKLAEYSAEELREALKCEGTRLVLVRDRRVMVENHGHRYEDLDRTWAYVRDGELPETCDSGEGGFEDGYKIPARYHAELAAVVEALA